jgi:hypothetical protein
MSLLESTHFLRAAEALVLFEAGWNGEHVNLKTVIENLVRFFAREEIAFAVIGAFARGLAQFSGWPGCGLSTPHSGRH